MNIVGGLSGNTGDIEAVPCRQTSTRSPDILKIIFGERNKILSFSEDFPETPVTMKLCLVARRQPGLLIFLKELSKKVTANYLS